MVQPRISQNYKCNFIYDYQCTLSTFRTIIYTSQRNCYCKIQFLKCKIFWILKKKALLTVFNALWLSVYWDAIKKIPGTRGFSWKTSLNEQARNLFHIQLLIFDYVYNESPRFCHIVNLPIQEFETLIPYS